MKQWKKKCLCKRAYKMSLFSIEWAERFLSKHHLDKFFDQWEIPKRRGVLK